MQEEPHGDQFVSELIDEQIAQVKQGNVYGAANARLVEDLESMYREEHEEVQAIERIHLRLMAKVLPASEQAMQLPTKERKLLPRKWSEQTNRHKERTDKHIWTRQWSVLAAVLIATLMVGSLLVVLQLARTATQKTAARQPAEQKASPGMYLGIGNQIIKVDMQTYKVQWRFTVEAGTQDLTIYQLPYTSYTPIVVGESVYFTTYNKVYALNVQTGALRWERTFPRAVMQQYIVNDILYVSTALNDGSSINYEVYALNTTNGTTKTQYKVPGSVVGIFDGIMYLNGGNTLTAERIADGNELWQTQAAAKQNWNMDVYVKNGILYTSSAPIEGFAPQNSYVYTINRQNGKIIWQSPMEGVVSNIAVSNDGRIYCGSNKHLVYAFDPKAKKALWQYHATAGHVYPAPIVLNGVVYAGQSSAGENGPINDQLIALDAATGQQKWATQLIGYTEAGNNDPLVLHNGVIYLTAGSRNGKLLGIATDSGKQVLSIAMDTLTKSAIPMRVAITIIA